MAWPTTGQAFFRNPESIYKHDGFGHDRGDDAGVRSACFRVVPHSGLDFTGRGPILSVGGGYVVASEWSAGAGWAVIEDVTIPGYGRVWMIYFHAAFRMLSAGSITRPGQQLGTIGDTGTGTSRNAFHLHLAAAGSLDAALRLIRTGNFARRAGETASGWAKRMGLLDPLPIIRAAVAAQSRPTVPTAPPIITPPVETPAQREERELMSAEENIVRRLSAKMEEEARTIESRLRAEVRGYTFLEVGTTSQIANDRAEHAVLIGLTKMRVLLPPVWGEPGKGLSQVDSMKAVDSPDQKGVDYRSLDFVRPTAPLRSTRFWNKVKDSATELDLDDDGRTWTVDEGRAWVLEREARLLRALPAEEQAAILGRLAGPQKAHLIEAS